MVFKGSIGTAQGTLATRGSSMLKYSSIALLVFLTACTAVMTPPSRFPQLNERAISDVDKYSLPRWSRNGTHIAYVNWDTRALFVYEVATGRRWTVATEVDRYFSWTAEERLSYLRYRPELSGSPFPAVYDLHIVDLDGKDDRIIASPLYNPMSIAWFKGGQQFVTVAAAGKTREADRDVFLVNVLNDTRNLLTTRQQLNAKDILDVSLSSDEKSLAISVTRTLKEGDRIVLVIFDLASQSVMSEVIPSQVFPHTYVSNGEVEWVAVHTWLSTYGTASEGRCKRYALLFFDVANLSNSFCLPTAENSIGYAEMSPDASKVVFLTPVSPGHNYVMLGELPPEYQAHFK